MGAGAGGELSQKPTLHPGPAAFQSRHGRAGDAGDTQQHRLPCCQVLESASLPFGEIMAAHPRCHAVPGSGTRGRSRAVPRIGRIETTPEAAGSASERRLRPSRVDLSPTRPMGWRTCVLSCSFWGFAGAVVDGAGGWRHVMEEQGAVGRRVRGLPQAPGWWPIGFHQIGWVWMSGFRRGRPAGGGVGRRICLGILPDASKSHSPYFAKESLGKSRRAAAVACLRMRADHGGGVYPPSPTFPLRRGGVCRPGCRQRASGAHDQRDRTSGPAVDARHFEGVRSGCTQFFQIFHFLIVKRHGLPLNPRPPARAGLMAR